MPGTPVYIADLAAFLPNAPVENDDMERILGMVGELPSRTRRRLRPGQKLLCFISESGGSPSVICT